MAGVSPDIRVPGFNDGRTGEVFNKLYRVPTVEKLREELTRAGISDLPHDERMQTAAEGSPLAQEITVRGRTISNRAVISPMEGWDGLGNGLPSPRTLRRLARQGASGAGLLWGLEAYAVQADGRANPLQLYHNDRIDPARTLSLIIKTVTDSHANSFGQASAEKLVTLLQLTHSGRWCKPNVNHTFEPRVAYNHPLLDGRVKIAPGDRSRVFTTSELDGLIERYVLVARAAREAGFPGVDIKACHGYLLHEFLSAFDRDDQYGGSYAGRSRLLREIVKAVRAEWPDGLIGVRLSMYDTLPYIPDPDFKFDPENPKAPVPGALAKWDGSREYPVFGANRRDPSRIDLTETIILCTDLAAEGVDMINGTACSPYYNSPFQRPAVKAPIGAAEATEHQLLGVYRMLAAAHTLQAALPGTPIVGSALTPFMEAAPLVMQGLIRAGWVQFAGLGRSFLSYPNLIADVLRDGKLGTEFKVCRQVGACTSVVRATDPVTALPLGDSGCLPFDPEFKAERDSLINYERTLVDNNPPPVVVVEKEDLSFSDGHYDFAAAGDEAALRLLSNNIAKLYPGYSIRQVTVRDGEELRLNAEARSGQFYVLQGGKAQVSFFEHGQIFAEAEAKQDELATGDLLMMAGADLAKVKATNGDVRFWVIEVEGRLEKFDYRRGVTKLSRLENELGGCNDGSKVPNAQRDFRRLIYSTHTQHGPGANLPIEMHAVLINPSTSTPHYHPKVSIGGTEKQHELYLALDHHDYGLTLEEAESRFTTWPDGTSSEGAVTTLLKPGDAASIPYGVGHQAGGLIMVVALPGFYGKQNEINIGSQPPAA